MMLCIDSLTVFVVSFNSLAGQMSTSLWTTSSREGIEEPRGTETIEKPKSRNKAVASQKGEFDKFKLMPTP